MPAQRPLTDLAERKRLLVLQADLHRALLRVEGAKMRERMNWWHEARNKVRSASPWLAVGAGAVGLLAASRWRKLANWVPVGLAAWRWVQKFKTG